MRRLVISDVKWDTDGENVDLPTTFFLDVNESEMDDDTISDMISSKFGYCHKGFTVKGNK